MGPFTALVGLPRHPGGGRRRRHSRRTDRALQQGGLGFFALRESIATLHRTAVRQALSRMNSLHSFDKVGVHHPCSRVRGKLRRTLPLEGVRGVRDKLDSFQHGFGGGKSMNSATFFGSVISLVVNCILNACSTATTILMLLRLSQVGTSSAVMPGWGTMDSSSKTSRKIGVSRA